MTEPNQKAAIFLAFAQDREDKVGSLRNLPKELEGIRPERLGQKAQPRIGIAGCEVVERAGQHPHKTPATER